MEIKIVRTTEKVPVLRSIDIFKCDNCLTTISCLPQPYWFYVRYINSDNTDEEDKDFCSKKCLKEYYKNEGS